MKKKSIILYFSLFLNFILLIFTALYCYVQNTNLLKTNRFLITGVLPIAVQYERGTPIDRYYIENFLQRNKQYIKGDILEMENTDYTYKFGHDITSSSIMDLTNKKATLMHNLQDTKGLPENKFDCYICTQTLPYMYDIKAAFASAKKMLKKNGVFLVTATGLAPLSYKRGSFYEYWHFTDQTLLKLAEDAGFRKIEVEFHGNAAAATAFFQGLAQEDLKNKSVLDAKDTRYPVIVTLKAVK